MSRGLGDVYKRQVTIRWIKAHVGHPGNEHADEEAKLGSKAEMQDGELPAPTSKATCKMLIKLYVRDLWNLEWQDSDQCRQTKIFFRKVLPRTDSRGQNICKLSRDNCAQMIRWITGHNFLRRHQGLVDEEDALLCHICQENEETSSHIILECPGLSHLRQDYLGQPLHSTELDEKWKVFDLNNFLNHPLILILEGVRDEEKEHSLLEEAEAPATVDPQD